MDTINPFDQFDAELRSTLPDEGNSAPLPGEASEPKTFDLSVKKPKSVISPTPVMNPTPVMGIAQQSPMMGTMNGAAMNGPSNMMNGAGPVNMMNGGSMGMMGGTNTVAPGTMGAANHQEQNQWGQQPVLNSPTSLNPGAGASAPIGTNPSMNNVVEKAIVPSDTPYNVGADLVREQAGQQQSPQQKTIQWESVPPQQSQVEQPPPQQGGGWGQPPPPPQEQPPAPPSTPAGDDFDIFAASPSSPQCGVVGQGSNSAELVPNNAVNDDPFGVFGSGPAPEPAPTPVVTEGTSEALTAASNQAVEPSDTNDDDFFGTFFNNPRAASAETTEPSFVPVGSLSDSAEGVPSVEGLPSEGKFHKATIYTATVGVVFLKPQELKESLFLQTDQGLVDALGERPTVAFMVKDSSAREAGVDLGHVLLKVNDIEVNNPKEATRIIGEMSRPIVLSFYVPDITVTVFEGMHMVKYDERTKCAPVQPQEWKPKYVVVGGIIGKKWQINMFRNKTEYDIAVMEVLDGRPVSVKVKQFGLYQGTRIVCDPQGRELKSVKYRNCSTPWNFIVVKAPGSFPIKISSTSLDKLKPVHKGIRRVLAIQAAQRDRGYYQPEPDSPTRVTEYPH